jgi:glycerol-3-phosphate acyltransferase PlsY
VPTVAAFPSGGPDTGLVAAVALLVLGLVCGSVPTSMLVGRAFGVDVLRAGEANPGAANVWRLAGARAGIVALVLDMGRAIVPGLVGWAVAGYWGAVCGALGAEIGAVRPIVPRLRGGRGVGTAAGAGLVIEPVAGAIGFLVAIVVGLATRRPALATVAGFVAYPTAWVVLGVRSSDTLVPMAGIGLIALVAVARWGATRQRRA